MPLTSFLFQLDREQPLPEGHDCCSHEEVDGAAHSPHYQGGYPQAHLEPMHGPKINDFVLDSFFAGLWLVCYLEVKITEICDMPTFYLL
jgi:hypothetical protein